MDKQWAFDSDWTKDFTRLRQEFVRDLLATVCQDMKMSTALDVGCGLGDFSKFLDDLGYRVTGLDGRAENTAEAQRRHPNLKFDTVDAEELSVASLGTFDLVLCFGLLYHLENPFRVIRHLQGLTEKLLLIETMCLPDHKPTMELLEEGVAEDQGLNYVAFYPSEPCLIKMLYRAGFPFVYRFRRLPKSELFQGGLWRKKQRTFLAASKFSVAAPNAILVRESGRWTPNDVDPWGTGLSGLRHSLFQMRIFASRALAPIRKAVGAKSKQH